MISRRPFDEILSYKIPLEYDITVNYFSSEPGPSWPESTKYSQFKKPSRKITDNYQLTLQEKSMQLKHTGSY